MPATIALVFAYLRGPTRGRLALVAASGLVLAVVHPTYALFTLLVLGGYAVVRLLVAPEELRTLAIAGGALALGAIVFLAWLFPTVQDTASFTPSGEQVQSKQHGFDRYPGQFIVKSDSRFHLNPEVITRAGPVPLAALCLVPLALFAVRRRWAALVLGGTLAVLGVLLLDRVFAPFVDAVSLSQARRLAGFLPLGFALAGGAAVLARVLSSAVLPLALARGDRARVGVAGRLRLPPRGGRPDAAGLDRRSAARSSRSCSAFALRSTAADARAGGLGSRRRRAPSSSCPMIVTSGWDASAPAPGAQRPGSSPRCGSTPSRATSSSRTPRRRTGSPRRRRSTSRSRRRRTSGDTKANRPYERVARVEGVPAAASRAPGRTNWIVLDKQRVKQRVACPPKVYEDTRYLFCRIL